MQASGLSAFHDHEVKNVMQPHNPGPLKEFLVRVSKIQAAEEGHRTGSIKSQAEFRP